MGLQTPAPLLRWPMASDTRPTTSLTAGWGASPVPLDSPWSAPGSSNAGMENGALHLLDVLEATVTLLYCLRLSMQCCTPTRSRGTGGLFKPIAALLASREWGVGRRLVRLEHGILGKPLS